MMKNKQGQMVMIQLLFLFMTIVVTVALLPGIKSIMDVAQASDNMNCQGFIYNGDPNATLSYNSSLETNQTACIAIDLYLPYILLVVLIGGVSRILYGSPDQQQQF
jgi:uncharacterized membrane protein